MSRVLLVEDEDLVAMLTEDMLADLGFKVSATAASLSEGMRVAMSETFDVAVLDINLRGELSYPIADLLTERGIPFVFASGYAHHGLELGYRHVPTLGKPFSRDSLQAIISEALRDR